MSQFDMGLVVGFIIGLCVGVIAVGLMVLRRLEAKDE
jgi:F0F1-type ATP synthase assembly protein I